MMKRRDFLKAGVTAAGAWVAWKGGFITPKGWAYDVSPGLKKFNQPLPLFGANIGVPGATIDVAIPDITTYTDVDYYEIQATMFRQPVAPLADMKAALGASGGSYTGTRFYGYQQLNGVGGTPGPAQALGSAVVATKGKPVRIKFKSNLPGSHILPFDSTIPQGGATALQDHAAIHLHGGLVPWTADGGPFHWQANPANHGGDEPRGASVEDWLPDMNGNPTFDYYYPNNQSCRLMWYHDHGVGITRLNAYAGVATGYLLTDTTETALAGSNGIPLLGQPLVFQDKVFWNGVDAAYPVSGAQPGDLWYPYVYDPIIWALAPGGAPPPTSIVTEMFGDTMMVNSAVYPYTDITTDRVRYRLLNACNSRFLNLSFVLEDPLVAGEPILNGNNPVAAPVNVWLLGTEGGFLANPVQLFLNGKPTFRNAMLVGPAERFDIIVDFSLCAGQKVILYNDAPGPFPGGAPIFDFFFAPQKKKPVNVNAPLVPGYGPNTRTIMQFRVGTGLTATGMTVPPAIAQDIPVTVAPIGGGALPAFPTPLPPLTVPAPPAGFGWGANDPFNPRYLTLNEETDQYGRLMPTIGTNTPVGFDPVTGAPIFGLPYPGTGAGYLPTETVQYGKAEIWKLINLTADTHPMHFHLFNVRVLSREKISAVKNYAGGIPITDPASLRGPEWNEMGWKETVKAHPGEVTTVFVLVEHPLPGGVRTVSVSGQKPGATPGTLVGFGPFTGTLPSSPRLKRMGVIGDEYVWHCHILEHEEHDMMRPLVGI